MLNCGLTLLSAMLVQDWYGHVRTHTSMSKSRAQNRVMHETCTEQKSLDGQDLRH